MKEEWSLVFEGFDPEQEGLREALCTLGNGYFATRGAAEESHADDIHYPGTYFAGCYNRLETTIAGRTITNEDLVNCPNWLPLAFRLGEDDRWFNLRAVEIREYRQELDLEHGVLTRRIAFADPADRRFTLVSRRLVHMGKPHLAAIELAITSENWSGPITVRSGLDGSVINAGVARYRELNGNHLELVDIGEAPEGSVFLLVRTNQSRVEIAEAARTRIFRDDDAVPTKSSVFKRNAYIARDLAFEIKAGATVRVEKVVALYTSRDPAITESATEARRAAAEAGSFEDLHAEHVRSWTALWRRMDIILNPGSPEQNLLRLNIFHLAQCVSLFSAGLDVGVPARGLHGEAYRGHVFWDELFIFPPVTGKLPAITRSLLMYRYRRLDAARRLAAKAGFRGAMYPWQSGSNGDEESQRLHFNPRSGKLLPDNSYLQRHVNLAIVYNMWRYVHSTDDKVFLSLYGADMALEIARFFDSLTTFSEDKGRYEIKGVMGPDEYHDAYPEAHEPGLNNNAYTNVMTAWGFKQVLTMLDRITAERRAELTAKLDLRDEEIARWGDISRRMFVPFHGDGIISQFEGYEELEEFDWEGYRKKYGNISRLDRILEAEGDTPNRYRASKQADVCMLFFLLPLDHLVALLEELGYRFDEELMRRNVDYYLARTSHGSTLSNVVHASVLARADPERAWPLFCESLTADQLDVQGGTTAEGIHLGAMAGAVDIIESSYMGIDRLSEHLRIVPRFPSKVRELHLRENFQGRWYDLRFCDGRLDIELTADGQGPATVTVADKDHKVEPGGVIRVEI